MALVIVGLSPNGDLGALRTALTRVGLPAARLRAIDPTDVRSALTGGLAGSRLLQQHGGTSVPGMTSRLQPAFSGYDSIASRLADLEIPDGVIANYAEALERGRHVFAYPTNAADAERVEEAFTSAGVANVRRYGGVAAGRNG